MSDLREHPFILGSAGHIDHGKTTLVKALTGVDCDRLSEEKRRKITIELGFAPLKLPSGAIISIIDVPGHERFIRQMASGTAGVDAAMLVIDASEGVMPQTREHVEILTLLGATAGVIVLNKMDLVDEEMLELAADEARELVRGTFLADAPILPVSALNGKGVPELVVSLGELVQRTKPRDRRGAFFMPIDRAFGMKGFGCVVTGTVYHGTLHEGDEVELLPSGLKSKVRQIQVHGAAAAEATAGNRAALNLAALSLEQVERGDVACAPGAFTASSCLDARLDLLPSAPDPIKHWQRVRVHIGSSDAVARILLLGGMEGEEPSPLLPGTSAMVQLLPETPLPVAFGERFIIRFYSPLRTIAGGTVLLPEAQRPKNATERRRRATLLRALNKAGNSPAARIAALVEERGLMTEAELRRASQLEQADFDHAVKSAAPLSFGRRTRFFCSGVFAETALKSVMDDLAAFHRERPELPGKNIDELNIPDLDPRERAELLALFAAQGKLALLQTESETRFALPNFKQQDNSAFLAAAERTEDLLKNAGFNLLDIPTVSKELALPPKEITNLISFLKEKKGLRIIAEGLLLPKETADAALDAAQRLSEELSVASFRDELRASRKMALALLEFFDSEGITRRMGDRRILLKVRT